MDGVINRYTWHKTYLICGSLQKALTIKPYILNVIRHKTYKKVKGVQPHIYVLSIKASIIQVYGSKTMWGQSIFPGS